MGNAIRYVAVVMLCMLCALGCGGEGEIGESCDDPGSEDACVDGAICTNEGGDEGTCREICEAHEDCDDGYKCNGVTGGSTKSCQPDDAGGDGDGDGDKKDGGK